MLKSVSEGIDNIIKTEIPPLPEDATEQEILLHKCFVLDQITQRFAALSRAASAEFHSKAELPSIEGIEIGQATVKHHVYYDVVVLITPNGKPFVTINALDDGTAEATKMARLAKQGVTFEVEE